MPNKRGVGNPTLGNLGSLFFFSVSNSLTSVEILGWELSRRYDISLEGSYGYKVSEWVLVMS